MSTFCIFGFNNHKPYIHDFQNSVMGLDFTMRYLDLAICGKCEKILKKAYEDTLHNSNGWMGSFEVFKAVCIGERLKYVATGFCGCKNELNKDERNRVTGNLNSLFNKYMRCDYK